MLLRLVVDTVALARPLPSALDSPRRLPLISRHSNRDSHPALSDSNNLMKTTSRLLIGLTLLGFVSTTTAQRAASRTLSGQRCWVVASDQVELAITRTGGHMAPVTFFRDSDSPVAPYYISPWQGDKLDYPVPVLVPLRGDFFCLPFGGNGTAYNGEEHPPHGETAGSEWKLGGVEKQGDITTLTLKLKTKVREGEVTKRLSLRDGDNVVYSSHVINGFTGRTSLGHHATLAMPDKEGSFKISHSPIKFGLTNPTQFSSPANAEYQQLGIGQKFQSLTSVPSIFKGAKDVDCSRLPQTRGYADLLMIFPKDTGGKPAWLTAVRKDQGWMWFSLKDPKVLTATVFWLENHGRHGLPWFGRNNCVGMEDVTAFFADGLAPSAGDNILTREGIQTSVDIKDGHTVNYIQGVVKIPAGYTETDKVEFGAGSVTFVSKSGFRVKAPVRHDFLKSGKL